MLHQYINGGLAMILVALMAYIMHYAAEHESYANYTLSQAEGGFASVPCDNRPVSPFLNVSSCAFAQSDKQPFATSCASRPTMENCPPQDVYTCTIDRHNRVECKWGGQY